VGTYVFPVIIKNAGGADTIRGNQAPFWVSSCLCVFSAALAVAFIPHIGQDTIVAEDLRFRNYLQAEGWDVSQLGIKEEVDEERGSQERVKA
jgi:hypothetical protein